MIRDMAGNTSTPLMFDIFIDATAPIPQITNTATDEVFKPDETNILAGITAEIGIGLALIHMGDEEPDIFTILQLIDEDGNLIRDFLANHDGEHEFTYRFNTHGTYTLLLAAIDDVGNELSPTVYMIHFREMTILETMLQDTPLGAWEAISNISDTTFFAIIAGFVVSAAGGTTLIIVLRRRRKAYMSQDVVIIDE
jgi:hypothetical protein